MTDGVQRASRHLLTVCFVLSLHLPAGQVTSAGALCADPWYIEVMPAVRGGKPRLAGTRITVDDVVLMHFRLGQSLEEIAGKYDLSLAAVYSAMAYYYDILIHEVLTPEEIAGRVEYL